MHYITIYGGVARSGWNGRRCIANCRKLDYVQYESVEGRAKKESGKLFIIITFMLHPFTILRTHSNLFNFQLSRDSHARTEYGGNCHT